MAFLQCSLGWCFVFAKMKTSQRAEKSSNNTKTNSLGAIRPIGKFLWPPAWLEDTNYAANNSDPDRFSSANCAVLSGHPEVTRHPGYNIPIELDDLLKDVQLDERSRLRLGDFGELPSTRVAPSWHPAVKRWILKWRRNGDRKCVFLPVLKLGTLAEPVVDWFCTQLVAFSSSNVPSFFSPIFSKSIPAFAY